MLNIIGLDRLKEKVLMGSVLKNKITKRTKDSFSYTLRFLFWDYIESQLELGKEVSPGVIFPKRPKDPDCLNLIEKLFEEEGISVVWEDESIAERKIRL